MTSPKDFYATVKYYRFYCTVCTKDTFCPFMRSFVKKKTKNEQHRNFDVAVNF